MSYKRRYHLKIEKRVKGRPTITAQNPSKERKNHVIRFSDSEWKKIQEKAAQCSLSPSGYLREVALGHDPKVLPPPNPELSQILAKYRQDIVNFWNFIKSKKVPRDVLLRWLAVDENLRLWTAGIRKEINTINLYLNIK